MTFDIDPGLLVGFVLALVRASAWLVVAPPFNSRVIPSRVKIGLAGALALAVAPRVAGWTMPTDVPGLVGAVTLQIAIGLSLGFVANVLFSALQAAGSFLDLFGGFTIAQAYDPLSLAQSSVLGRAYQLLAVTILFAIDGHLVLVNGFIRSFQAVPPSGVALGDLSRLILEQVGLLFLAAVQIAAPLVAALFLTELALGLLSRAAPQLNVFMLGFPLKILLTLLLVGITLPHLPGVVGNLLEHVNQGSGAVVRLFASGG